jgi:hypothetical protein
MGKAGPKYRESSDFVMISFALVDLDLMKLETLPSSKFYKTHKFFYT